MNKHRRDIWIFFGMAIAIAVFFQLSNAGVLLAIHPWQNMEDGVHTTESSIYAELDREKYLVIYSPADVESVLTRHIIEKILTEQKKDVDRITLHDDVDWTKNYSAVILATNRLHEVKSLSQIESFVEEGGSAMLLGGLQAENMPSDLRARIGIVSMGKEHMANGIFVNGTMYPGIQGFSFDSTDYSTSLTEVELDLDAVPELTASNGEPIVWTKASGKGKYIVSNGRERDDKTHFGLYTAMLSILQADYIYPIMNMKIFYIDDFPSPVPEGNFARLYEETGMRTEDFYRKLWWPLMLEIADEYDVKYTGLIIESYGDQVKGPFRPLADGDARNNLIVYGRELLQAGGELGIHGYNHQSLAPAKFHTEALGYNIWETQADMEESLRELKRYIEDVYPDYKIRAYVPPSNIFSPEGRSAVRNVFTDIKVIGSLYDAPHNERPIPYVQEFGINKEDGLFDIPRVSSGYVPNPESEWSVYNVIVYNGIFSHFVHPDEIFYDESAGTSWAMMHDGLWKWMENLHTYFPWLQPVTASEAAEKMQDFYAMDYRLERSSSGIILHAWNFHNPLSFVLRTQKEIESVTGGTYRKEAPNTYILTVEDDTFEIQWAGEPK